MFIDDYQKDYKAYELAKESIINNGRSIVKYSTFNLKVIGNILAKVVTTIEGREFVFKEDAIIRDITDEFPHGRLNLIVGEKS